MDRHVFAIPAEVIKLALGSWIIYHVGSWYNLDEIISGGSVLIMVYLGVSILLTFYFILFEKVRSKNDMSISV
jgi:hypothetical protein